MWWGPAGFSETDTFARHWKEIHARLKAALPLSSKEEAEKAILKLADEVSSWSQNLADWLETAAPEITAHMEFPEGLWLRIRSNNLLERFNRELRRRVRLAGIFSNSASLLRLITAMTVEQDEEWRNERRYLNPELLEMLPLRKVG